MSIKISVNRNIPDNKVKNFVLFADENFGVKGLTKISLAKQSNYINKTVINNRQKDKDFLIFNLNSTQKILLIKIKENLTSVENEKIGAKFYNFIKEKLKN